ncbi:MAG: flippase-like domain-containing protein [Myxococcales bacterium]|nr:flippase-like domain-containing protein [Myxococcales bacterium]
MKLAINLLLSVLMLALCLWLVWPNEHGRAALSETWTQLDWAEFLPTLLGFYGLIAVVHVCRSWRWNYLLAPLGVRIPFGRMLAVSSAGFAAILLLPARLGEFVRPALIRKKGEVSASAALGTVFVERVGDGVVVSLMVVGCFFALHGPSSPGWMMPTAYLALAGFTTVMLFLVFAMWRPAATVQFALKLTLLPRFAPRAAEVIEQKLLELIRGFAVLKDRHNLARFAAWSVVYWVANGFATWILARGLGLPLSLTGAFATMGLVAVGISLPNSPGLVGQFQWLTMLGVSLDLGSGVLEGTSPLYGRLLTYAIFIHGLQVVWYVGAGLAAIASPYVSLGDVWRARKLAPEAIGSDDPAS